MVPGCTLMRKQCVFWKWLKFMFFSASFFLNLVDDKNRSINVHRQKVIMKFKKLCPCCSNEMDVEESYFQTYWQREYKCKICAMDSVISFRLHHQLLFCVYVLLLSALIMHPALLGLYSYSGLLVTSLLIIVTAGPIVKGLSDLKNV